MAERFGMIQAIDVWMVRQALAPASGARAGGQPLGRHALRRRRAREIVALLHAAPEAAGGSSSRSPRPPAPEHLDAARDFADELTALGCGLALDDFGTGFGSFTYLRLLPLRYLKIDQSFVLGLCESRDDQRVVQSIIGIASQFGLRTIAEGVEDEPTLELLREIGADYVQGFHIGRPVPLASP